MRPVLLIGKGAECAELPKVLELGVPVLTSWQALDLLDNHHPMYFGRPGTYGQRCANRILAEADQVISIGCRCSVWAVGYTFKPFAHVMCDIDAAETDRYPTADARNIPAAEFIGGLQAFPYSVGAEWLKRCATLRHAYPWVEGLATHQGYINPYYFIYGLATHFAKDQIIVTDTGTPYVVAHQVLRLKRPQRLIASGGLSEMGAGLPGAIGAAIGTGRSVLMLSGDGGFMMNLQELATVGKLPIKMVIFNNGGYNMIKRTQENLNMLPRGTGTPDVAMPPFGKVAEAFGIPAYTVRTWDDFDCVAYFMNSPGPALLEVFTSPTQPLLKLNPSRNADGTIHSPEFWDLTYKEVAA